jgi:hypothetical protein
MRAVKAAVENASDHPDPVGEAVEFGIDVSPLYENLKKTPTERLVANLRVADFVDELRRAKQRKDAGAKARNRPMDTE